MLAQGAPASDVFQYTVSDTAGATSTASLTINLSGTNDAPVAVADTASSTENQTILVNVLANDTDVDDGHVFTLVSASAPASVAIRAASSFVLIPPRPRKYDAVTEAPRGR